MEARLVIPLFLVITPSVTWVLLKQLYSPWWLENISSTPLVILLLYLILMVVLLPYLSYVHCITYFAANVIFVIALNNLPLQTKNLHAETYRLFQFNMKYHDTKQELDELLEYLNDEEYHLIALQGVSQQAKQYIIEKLSPNYPNFITGENRQVEAYSDQLVFSPFSFSGIKYYKTDHSVLLISSIWHPGEEVFNLYTLHPPSPRNEKLWLKRNKTLYQLKQALNYAKQEALPVRETIVLGDLNLSKHSSRLTRLFTDMDTRPVNSWPNFVFIPNFLALAIDHVWVSKGIFICARERVGQYAWSDHYAIKTCLTLDNEND